MNTKQLAVFFQHIINQMSWTWSLPLEDCDPDKTWQEFAGKYLSLVQARTKFKKVGQLFLRDFLMNIESCFDCQPATPILCVDNRYPSALRHIAKFPLALFVRGNLDFAAKRMVAVVGARRATKEALNASHELGFALANRGFCVVSGGAFGCDAAAHQGVLSSNQPFNTVAVFASSVDNPYPRHLRTLYEDILQRGGTLLSERLPCTMPLRHDFPIRNRIIAGMSEELHLIQAGERSGALITANLALDFGREVKVWNPALGDIRFLGNNRLLKSGAENSQLSEKTIDWQSL